MNYEKIEDLMDLNLSPDIENLINLPNDYDKNNEQLKTLVETYFSVIDDFMKYYILYKKDPEVSEYSNAFFDAKNQIKKINAGIFALKNQIENSSSKINNSVFQISKRLEKEKEKNERLKKLLAHSKKANNGSDILIEDYIKNYRRQYISNITMMIGIGIVGYILKGKMNPTTATSR